MDSRYDIADTSEMLSPSLVIFREVLDRNLRTMLSIAGDVRRLRPHCKTHKMTAVTKIELALGITKHKCATFAEAEMLADAGVKDIFLAYNLVGPNIARAVKFLEKYPAVEFFVTADDRAMIEQLSRAMTAANKSIGVLLDLDSGQHRTGIADPQRAADIYRRLAESPGIRPSGFHLYDGQNHQRQIAERTAAVMA
ncbi:MAG: D-TA family PLP-dependent enzyme, partial [Planctomycetaceae bacterium]|nr:D-TA family PLP-dependent enzyme [Planctomycetaceae bacterium]